MSTVILFGAWLVVTTLILAFAIRPWKTPAARAPLPLALCFAMMIWVLVSGAIIQANLMKIGSWTAASTTMAFVPLKAIFMALLAYWSARTLLAARTGAGPASRWVLPACLSIFTLYLVVSDVQFNINGARERHARSTILTPHEVEALAHSIRTGEASPDEQSAFLANPLCPPELLAEFATSQEPRWRRAVARNDTIATDIAETLAQDSNEQVRYMLAFNRKLPPAILSRLSTDTSESVRETVAWTDGLPDEDFNRLISDPSPRVRATVALQNRLSKEGHERLLADPEKRVRDAANRWQ